jgi:hypothetical protein
METRVWTLAVYFDSRGPLQHDDTELLAPEN